MEEIWKNIRDIPNYQISNLGRVKSLERKVAFGINAVRFRKIPNRILKPVLDDKGYFQVTISGILTTAKRNRKIHQLVAKHFIPNPKRKPHVNHKDGNKKNNHYSNLEWCTQQENNLHAYRVLKRKSFFDGKEATWNHIPVIQLDRHTRKKIKAYKSITQASIETKTFIGNIVKCINGKRNHTGGFKWKYA